MEPTLFKSKSDVSWWRAALEFIFEFESKRGEILYHWIAFTDGLSFSTEEFYQRVEEEIKARNLPDLAISRQEFAETSLLSGKRSYLRIMRERLTLDTCAAPFGTTFFFSCRTLYAPALVRLWHILAVIVFLGAIGGLLIRPLGLVYAVVAMVALAFALVATLRNVAVSTSSSLDSIILRVPVVSTIYENWFREETYYRYDTRLLYLKILPDLIKELSDDMVATKGVKLERQYERSPIFTELYKPVRATEPEPA